MLSKIFSAQKIFLLSLTFFLVATFFPRSTFAFSTKGGFGTYYLQFEQAVYQTGEMNLQSFVFETIKATGASVVSLITGCLSCSSGQTDFGASGSVIALMGAIYSTPPASGVVYLADLGSNLGLIKPAYAQQGIGYQKMRVYQDAWKAFRNVAYTFYILIFIVIGLAIMFRLKISPQAVITIQSAIPKLIISLILVTFSYAIVGFLIDLMYVLTNLILFTFKNNLPLGIFDWFKNFAPNDPITQDWELLGGMLMVGLPAILIPVVLLFAVGAAGGAIFGALTGGVAVIPIVVGGLIMTTIIAIVFFIALLRILWMLLKAYITVVLNLIFAPFLLLIGAIPGSTLVGDWFRSLIANLAIFPVVFTMSFLAGYLALYGLGETLANLFGQFFRGEPVFNNLMSAFANPATGDQAALLVTTLVSSGILLMTPKAGELIQSFIQKKPFAYGTAIGEAFGPPSFAARSGAQYRLGQLEEQARAKLPLTTSDRIQDAVLKTLKSVGKLR